MSRFINPQPQFILAGGELASGATMAFYETGTNDFKTIFADVNETTPIDNPITLGARGEVPDVFYSGTARVVAIDAEGTQIFDLDSVGTGGSTGAYSTWDSNTVYSDGDIVYGYDGYPYQSLVNENEGNDPTLNANNNANWTQLFRVTSYNAQVTYQPNDFVFYDGVIYRSVSSDNNANDPSTDGAANWVSVADARYVVYDNSSSGLTSLTGQAAIDELKNLIDNQPSSVVYRGQLDVSFGDAALPPSPTNGDLYVIAVSGTITLSVAGAAPTATAVNVGQQIIYNGTAMQWDLIAQIQQAASVSYSNITSGLVASDVQSALDEIEGRVDNTESNTTQNANAIGGLDSRLLSAEGTLSANGDVVTKNVVSSNTDTTNDRVVTTGWLNQGLTGALPASSDLHLEDINGITVRITIATANRPFENGVAKIHVYDSNNRVIQAYATDQNFTARKRYLNGVWQAWEYGVEELTTLELIARVRTAQEGDTITTTGFTSGGDGGGAQWKATITTGLTPSQTPANRGAAELVDGSGRLWVLQIDGYVKPEWFGAVGDGSTDDTAALQCCIDSANGNRGIVIELQPKLYIYSSLNVTNPINMKGVTNRTDLRSSLASGTCINISTPQQCKFSDLTLSHSVTRTGGETVLIYNPTTQNTRTIFENVVVASPYNGVNAKSVNALKLINCYFTSYINNAVMLENEIINDSGDHYFTGNTWDAGSEPNGVSIRQVNSGGLKLIGNKFLAGAYHYLASFNQTGTISPFDTSVLTVTGNSFENCTVAAMAFNAVAPTTFKYAAITGNQFSLNGATGILFNDPGHDYAYDFVISSNAFNMGGTSPVGINAGRLHRSLIGENSFLGNTTAESGIIVGANSANIKIGQQKFTSIATEWNISASATNIEFYGGVYESGSESALTSNAYGSLYVTPIINVTFTNQMPAVPRISAIPLNGGGVLSSSIAGVTKTGFQMLVYGVTNGGSVNVEWEAFF